jgi:Glycosyl hydrolases family 28
MRRPGSDAHVLPPKPNRRRPYPSHLVDLRLQKHNSDDNVNENSPIMVAAVDTPDIPADNFTMYKVTIRNPPFHTVRLGGDGVTVWGVRIQAPWNEPNTDGFDVQITYKSAPRKTALFHPELLDYSL